MRSSRELRATAMKARDATEAALVGAVLFGTKCGVRVRKSWPSSCAKSAADKSVAVGLCCLFRPKTDGELDSLFPTAEEWGAMMEHEVNVAVEAATARDDWRVSVYDGWGNLLVRRHHSDVEAARWHALVISSCLDQMTQAFTGHGAQA